MESEKEINTFTFNANNLFDIKDNNITKNLILKDNFLLVDEVTKEAIYQSKKIRLNTFLELVLSWNFTSLKDSDVSFLIKICGENIDSDFFTMGQFKDGLYYSFKNQDNTFGKVNTDILINKDLNNIFVKLKFVVKANSKDFKLHNISITKKESADFTFSEQDLIEKIINVPKINQRSVPKIGNSICSPTSLTMVLNYYNNDLNNVDVSSLVYDYGSNIYGNWTFNASYAYNYNLYSRVEYINNFTKVINYIKNDIPVIMSIGVATIIDPNNKINYPSGHLVVLVGFKKINNVWHAAVNDPATYDDLSVLKFYQLDAFLSSFKNYTYIIKETVF